MKVSKANMYLNAAGGKVYLQNAHIYINYHCGEEVFTNAGWVNEGNGRWQRQTEGMGGKTRREVVVVWIPVRAVMRMRMWLCATGFAGNWLNECILLPLIEHMPRIRSSRSHTQVVIVSSCGLSPTFANTFRVTPWRRVHCRPSLPHCLLWRLYWVLYGENGGSWIQIVSIGLCQVMVSGCGPMCVVHEWHFGDLNLVTLLFTRLFLWGQRVSKTWIMKSEVGDVLSLGLG